METTAPTNGILLRNKFRFHVDWAVHQNRDIQLNPLCSIELAQLLTNYVIDYCYRNLFFNRVAHAKIGRYQQRSFQRYLHECFCIISSEGINRRYQGSLCLPFLPDEMHRLAYPLRCCYAKHVRQLLFRNDSKWLL